VHLQKRKEVQKICPAGKKSRINVPLCIRFARMQILQLLVSWFRD